MTKENIRSRIDSREGPSMQPDAIHRDELGFDDVLVFRRSEGLIVDCGGGAYNPAHG
jgi:hypothetical protein